jgi:hypothetical protein
VLGIGHLSIDTMRESLLVIQKVAVGTVSNEMNELVCSKYGSARIKLTLKYDINYT